MAGNSITPEVLPAKNRRVLILYGSETGNSQDFAIDLGKLTERLRFRSDVFAMDHVGLRTLTEYTLVIFLVSTTGQGEIPKNARIFWKRLLSRKLPATVFSKVEFTTFGLGDSSYRQYNWGARKLHKRLLQLGAKEFYPRGEADERHDDGIDGSFLPWSISLRSYLLTEYPLPEGLSPIPQDVQLPPKIILERDSVIREMIDRFTQDRAKGIDRNGLDCKAARFSHIDAIDPERQENDLRDKRYESGQQLYIRLSERSAADINDYRGIDYLDRHNLLKDHAEKYRLEDSPVLSDVPPEDLLPIPDAWTATITQNDRITPEDHWQDVRHLAMVVHPKPMDKEPISRSELNQYSNKGGSGTTSDGQSNESAEIRPPKKSGGQIGTTAQPKTETPMKKQPKEDEVDSLFTSAGDSITLYPKNFPEDVQTLIDIMEWNNVADEPFKHWSERDDGIAIEHAPANCHPMENSTLRQLLTNNYDITAIPKRSFFDEVRFHAADPMHKERLAEFSEARFIDEYYDYTSRPRRSILEILQDFSSIKIPYQYMPTVFPLIRGRDYSIASAGSLMTPEESDGVVPVIGDTHVELLIAVVKYKTVLRKTRRGLCSRYIESLRPGTQVRIIVNESSAPFANFDSMQNPLLCIATGTGLAPVRAAFWERSAEEVQGRNVLFFGGRNEKADFFFKNEWPFLQVTVHTAFSRDQKDKVYVQDVIRREYKAVCSLIQEEATIMVCGSSGKMPVAVREALCDAMIKGGLCGTVAGAKIYLEENNVYWEEVW